MQIARVSADMVIRGNDTADSLSRLPLPRNTSWTATRDDRDSDGEEGDGDRATIQLELPSAVHYEVWNTEYAPRWTAAETTDR